MGGQGKMERYGDSAGSQKPMPSLAPPKLLTFVLDGKAQLPQ